MRPSRANFSRSPGMRAEKIISLLSYGFVKSQEADRLICKQLINKFFRGIQQEQQAVSFVIRSAVATPSL
jgi:hypothetical protein